MYLTIPSSLNIQIATSFLLLNVLLQLLFLRIYLQLHILNYFHEERAH